MKQLISVLVSKCEAADRYSGICLFTARLQLSFIAMLNILSAWILITGREKFISFLPPTGSLKFTLYLFGILSILYIILAVAYPKRKIDAIELTQGQVKSLYKKYLYYIAFVLILFILSCIRK